MVVRLVGDVVMSGSRCVGLALARPYVV